MEEKKEVKGRIINMDKKNTCYFAKFSGAPRTTLFSQIIFIR